MKTKETFITLVLSIMINSAAHAQYCIPVHRNQYVEPIIDGVQMGSISNLNNGYPLVITGYSDYSAMSTDLEVGSTYTLTVKEGAAFQYNFAAWIDYNHDQEFDASEKIGSTLVLNSYATGNISFTVPATVYNGTTRLRVRAVTEPFGVWDHSNDPCAPWEDGETEDYSVNISGGLENNILMSALLNPVSGITMGSEQLEVKIKNTGNTTATGFSVNYAINNGTPVTETYTGSILPDSSAEFTFSSSYDFNALTCYTISAWINWTDDQTSGDDSLSLVVCHTEPISGHEAWYLSSELCENLEPLGGPFNSTTNHTCMDDVFGPGNWNESAMESINPDSIFSPSSCFVFIDGSYEGQVAFQVFVNQNRVKMENWVASGGHLLLMNANSGELTGDELIFNLGFDNIKMIAAYNTAYAIPFDQFHPIFNGPYLPVTGEESGFYFATAAFYGPELTTLIADNDDAHFLGHEINIPLLAEKKWGEGLVIFGSLSPSQLVSPEQKAMNSRRNTIVYLNQCLATGANSMLTEDAMLSVFPNPNNGKFGVYIQANNQSNTEVRLVLINLFGQKVYEKKDMLASDQLNEEIIMHDEATGLYILRIIIGDKEYSREIIYRK